MMWLRRKRWLARGGPYKRVAASSVVWFDWIVVVVAVWLRMPCGCDCRVVER